MEFTLNLNISISTDLNIDLTHESSAILALIHFCQLNPNKHFKCFCYCTKKNLEKINQNVELIELSLNKNNSQFKFMAFDATSPNLNVQNAKDCILIKVLDEKTNDQSLNDTNLPSLIYNISKEAYMNITGLASLYRYIVKVSNKLKPSDKFQTLLVNRTISF